MAEWKVRAAERVCFAGGETLQEDEAFFSALYIHSEGIERRDYCRACWDERAKTETVAYWRLRGAEPEVDPTAVGPLDLSGLKKMLQADLVREAAPEGLAGLLALMLGRKKLAKILSVDAKAIRLRLKDDEEILSVPAPSLGGRALEKAQTALWELLDMMGAGSGSPSA